MVMTIKGTPNARTVERTVGLCVPPLCKLAAQALIPYAMQHQSLRGESKKKAEILPTLETLVVLSKTAAGHGFPWLEG
eukprot:583136-Pelagomonas_calceolata.AAC.1